MPRPVLGYDRVTHTEVRPISWGVRFCLAFPIVGFAITICVGIGLFAFVYWPQIAAATAVAVAAVLVAPVRTTVRDSAGHVDVSRRVLGLRLAHRHVLTAAVLTCDLVIGQLDAGGMMPWHRGTDRTVVHFSGDGAKLLLVGPEEIPIGSADPRRPATAIDAARWGTPNRR